MYSDLNHLSSEQINEIKTRYYQGDSVYQLMAEYDLQIAPAGFYKLFPPEPVEKYGCSECKVNLVVDAVSRSKQYQKKDINLCYCPVCGRKPFVDKIGWTVFPLLSDKEKEQKRQIIGQYFEESTIPVEYDTLSWRHKVYLAVLCKALMDKRLKTIRPLCLSEIKLAPSLELQNKIYKELIDKRVIVVSLESDLDAFDIDAKDFPQKYDIEKVAYSLNLRISQNAETFSDEIKRVLHVPSEDMDFEAYELWKEIAVAECIAYLQFRLDKVGFSFNPGVKTKEVFQKLLENFSISQIYYIIWCKVGDASRWYLEGGVSKQRAANSVVSACLRYGENAVFYERELPKYHRPAACPKSVLTRYFYHEILEVDNQGDDICIGKPRLHTIF